MAGRYNLTNGYPVAGIILNAIQMQEIASFYEIASTKEYLTDTYSNAEDELEKIAIECREIMDETMANGSPLTEGEAIKEACIRLHIKLTE